MFKHPHIDNEGPGFHYKDGWYFKRQNDDSVVIYHQPSQHEAILPMISIDKNSWASICASVSINGDDAKNFDTFLKLHGENPANKK